MSDRSRNRAAIVLTIVVLAACSGTAYAGLWPVKAREHLRWQLEDQASRNDRLEDVNAALRRRNHRLLRRLGWRERQVRRLRRQARARFRPSVIHAIQLASTIWHVPTRELVRVGSCESGLYPFAVNGRYRGVFQEGPMFERGPFARFGVFDPYANVFTAALTVSREGWRQWECRP